MKFFYWKEVSKYIVFNGSANVQTMVVFFLNGKKLDHISNVLFHLKIL